MCQQQDQCPTVTGNFGHPLGCVACPLFLITQSHTLPSYFGNQPTETDIYISTFISTVSKKAADYKVHTMLQFQANLDQMVWPETECYLGVSWCTESFEQKLLQARLVPAEFAHVWGLVTAQYVGSLCHWVSRWIDLRQRNIPNQPEWIWSQVLPFCRACSRIFLASELTR